ncbi:hypothetical protein LTS17_007583 [Exophiala oligosperma]
MSITPPMSVGVAKGRFDSRLEPYVLDCLARVKAYLGREADVEQAVAVCALVDMKNDAGDMPQLVTPSPEPAGARDRVGHQHDNDDDDGGNHDGSIRPQPRLGRRRPQPPPPAALTSAGGGKRQGRPTRTSSRGGSRSARASGKGEWASFVDARLPRGAAAGDALRAEEVRLCGELDITEDVYRCQRARFFLGIAAFTEEVRRRQARGMLRTQWNIGKTQFQLFGTMDANKSSKVFELFLELGWVQPAKQTPTSRDAYEQMFPPEHRDTLHREMRSWELEHITDSSLHVVTTL